MTAQLFDLGKFRSARYYFSRDVALQLSEQRAFDRFGFPGFTHVAPGNTATLDPAVIKSPIVIVFPLDSHGERCPF